VDAGIWPTLGEVYVLSSKGKRIYLETRKGEACGIVVGKETIGSESSLIRKKGVLKEKEGDRNYSLFHNVILRTKRKK